MDIRVKTVFCVLDLNGCNNRILRKRNRENEIFFFKQSKLEPKYTLLKKHEFNTFEKAFNYFLSNNPFWYNYYFYNVHKDYRKYILSQLLLINNEEFIVDYVRKRNEEVLKIN